LGNVKARLLDRRAELVRELEVDLPEVERRQAEIANLREETAKLERRRDAFAEFGASPIPIPQGDAYLPLASAQVRIEVEPLRSRETGAAHAKRVQNDIDELTKAIRDSEREIQRLLKGPKA
jgi:hypothetical protein